MANGMMGLFGMLPQEAEAMPRGLFAGEVRARQPTAGENARLAVTQMLTPILGPVVAERVGSTVENVLNFGPIPAQMATDAALQPVRAGEALGEALHDPTLSNVTNAGVQTAIALGRPAAALAALGGGYLEAGRRDLGLFSSPASADEPQGLFAQGAAAADPMQQLWEQRADIQNRLRDAQAKVAREERTGRGPNWQAAVSEVRQLEATLAGIDGRIAELQRLNSPEYKLEMERKAKEQEEYDRAVRRAEAARDFEMGRDRRFSDTEVGKVWERTGGFAPFAVGAGTGLLSRAASGGGRAAKDYVLPGALGAIAGASAANVPLAYNALYTEPDNPLKRAYEAYARELPPTHPRRQEMAEYAASLPNENPVRAAAAEELYDPMKLAERAIVGGAEGLLGGLVGSDVVRIPGRAVRALIGSRGASPAPRPAPPPPPPAPERIIERVDKNGRRYRFIPGKGRVPLSYGE